MTQVMVAQNEKVGKNGTLMLNWSKPHPNIEDVPFYILFHLCHFCRTLRNAWKCNSNYNIMVLCAI